MTVKKTKTVTKTEPGVAYVNKYGWTFVLNRLTGKPLLPIKEVKIPATPEGIPAVQTLIAEGININVTLIFSQETYDEVAEAFISGLEQRHAAGKPLDHVASVASVFVSRVDTLIDSQLEFRMRRSTDDKEKAVLSALRHGEWPAVPSTLATRHPV